MTDKRRRRRTKAEIERLRCAIWDLCREHEPLTVRQLFYLMVVAALIEKKQSEYNNVTVRLCGLMREEGVLPWNWIVDETRWMRKPRSYGSLVDALEEMQAHYRRDFWLSQDRYMETWCESASAAGVIYPSTAKWDIPLMPAHGFASKDFCWRAAKTIEHIGKPAHILYVGDLDLSGLRIDRDIEAKLRRYAPDADITFRRIAVTEEQVEAWNLPTSPPKDAQQCKWAVEVEAIPPGQLRQLVEDEIENLVDAEAYERVIAVEEAERSTLATMIGNLRVA